jgi:hypothetical protein
MEDVALLVFYLPIIIFEAMIEAQANMPKAEREPAAGGARRGIR